MPAPTPSHRFQTAAAYLSSSPALSNVSNDVKLELYALFKCITVSKSPQTPRPSLFDFAGRAKWDAWERLGKQSDEQDFEVWEQRYSEIAQSLGWQDDIQGDRPDDGRNTHLEAGSVKHDGERKGLGGGGMGVTVSAIPKPPPDPKDQGTLHAFALSNDANTLLSFLDIHPNADINSLDEYGYTPLHLAADRGNDSVVKVLLDKGADTNIQDPDEFTALALAEVGGHGDVVDTLRTHCTLSRE